MQIRAGFEISIRCDTETPLIALLDVHPTRVPDLRSAASIRTNHAEPIWKFTDPFGNTCLRTVAPAGVLSLEADFVIEDNGASGIVTNAAETPVESLPIDVLPYLLASRYCETDKLAPVAWSLFGETPRGTARVQSIIDFVRDHVELGYEYASPTLSAWDVYREKRGVFRDCVHLAVAFCRNVNIPARYVSGYLPTVGGDEDNAPMDFAVWMEAFIGGRWAIFDPCFDTLRPGRVAMAYGRDAADVAIYTSFGSSSLERFHVFAFQI